MKVGVQLLAHGSPHYDIATALGYAHEGDAGCDLRAAISEEVVLQPNSRAMIPTGICLEMPADIGMFLPEWLTVEAQVRPRSGLAAKHGIDVANSPGTVDYGYRGEVKVILENRGDQPYTVRPSERIAQIVFALVVKPQFVAVQSVSESERGTGGFGSTGQG